MPDENRQEGSDSGVRLNIEIKASSRQDEAIRKVLTSRGARFAGEDHQVDTYFNVSSGRLKLRKGNIENSLIYYNRSDQAGPKRSDVLLVRQPDPVLKGLLTASNGVKVVVDKRREIWYDGNVKIHLDRVEGLGTFVEIEAIDSDGTYSEERLLEQCTQFMELFAVQPRDLIERSYSDLILELRS